MKRSRTAEPIDKQQAARKALNERMATLVKQRDAFALEQAKKAPKPAADSFDRTVAETLRAQTKQD